MDGRASIGRFGGRGLLVFLGAAVVLRLPGHLNSGLWYDEIWTLTESIRVPFHALFTTFESDNNHPLYSVLAWLSVNAFGEHPWSLRLPALVFGVASIGMMWKLALLVAPRAEALLATTLLTISYHHVWFSQNARGYTMLLFWTLAATYFLVRIYSGEGRRAWVWYAICLALATFTLASAVLVAIAHGLVWAVLTVTSRVRRSTGGMVRWEPLWGILLAGAMSIVMHAGMLGEMMAFFGGDAAPGAQPLGPGPSRWTSPLWTVAAVVQSLGVPTVIGWSALAVVTACLVLGAVVIARRSPTLVLLYLLPGVTAVSATLLLGRSLRPRFLFHLGGFGLLILVAGVFATCELVARRIRAPSRAKAETWMKGTAAAGMVVASLAILPRAYTLPKQDYEGAMTWVESARGDGEAVATVGLTILPYRAYFDTDFRPVASVEDLDELLAQNDAVYVIHTLPVFLESAEPRLAARLVDSLEVARFRGSLGDGDVVVYRLPGRQSL